MDIRSKKGLSLVEVIVTVAIIGIIAAPISLVFITAYTNFITESDKATAEQCAREVLYGKGINSYGVMGDLERSNASKSKIKIEDVIKPENINKGRTIKITDDAGTKVYKFNKDDLVLYYNPDYKPSSSDKKYFDDELVKVIDFSAEMKLKGTVIDKTEIDTDVIVISATVSYGKSGNVKVESSYRINVED